jgi:hypothetical protein
MSGRTFIRVFWASLALTALAMALLVRVLLMPSWSARIAVPELPIPGRAYVSAYREDEVDHLLFHFGLFGFGDRIRTADLLIAGSSHPELALSAAKVSRAFVRPDNLPLKVFNMAVGYGESSGFARDLIEAHNVQGTMVVIDLFAPYGEGISPFGRAALELNIAQAYQRVGQMWAVYFRDWLTDPLLIRVRFSVAGGLSFERAMGRTLMRDWQNGDVVELWNAQIGSRYRKPGVDTVHPLIIAPQQPSDNSIPPEMAKFFAARAITPYAVLVPYPEGDVQAAMTSAKVAGIPFIEISSWLLEYYDRDHVSAAGREAATGRFIEGLTKLLSEPDAPSR